VASPSESARSAPRVQDKKVNPCNQLIFRAIEIKANGLTYGSPGQRPGYQTFNDSKP
jgi:hypothetical protein